MRLHAISRWRASSARSGCRRWRTGRRCWPGSRGAPGVTYGALAPNLKGYAAARAARARRRWRSSPRRRRRFSQRNINCSIAESLARFAPVAEAAAARRDAAARLCLLRDRLPVRGRNCAAERRSRGRTTCSRSAAARSASATPSATARLIRWRGCCRRCWTVRRGAAGRAFPRHPRAGARRTSRWRSTTGCGCSTRRAAGSAVAPLRRARKEMSRRNGWLRGWRSWGFATGLDLGRLAEAAAFARGLRGCGWLIRFRRKSTQPRCGRRRAAN